MNDDGPSRSGDVRERIALRRLTLPIDRGEAHGRETLPAGRIVVLLAWLAALVALVGGELLPRGLTSQLHVLHAACLQRVAEAAAPQSDCRMLDPDALVRVRRANGALAFEMVPRPASGDNPESRLLR